jgi:hypothetical protein
LPYANTVRLKRVQAGIETVRGTPATITRRVYGAIVRTHTQAIETVPDESGTFFGGEAVAQGDAEVGFTVDAVLTYEDAMWWAQLALDGAITPVADAGDPVAYTRVATPEGEVDNLKTATFEYGWANMVFRTTMVGVRRMTLAVNRADVNYWRLTADLFGRDITKISDFTASIPQRSRETVAAKQTHLFIDDVGDVGETEVLGKWRSFSVTVDNAPDFKRFGEGDEFVGADFGRGDQVVTGELAMEAIDDTEYEAQRTLTPRALRIEKSGSEINAGADKLHRIDLPRIYWNAPTENVVGANLVHAFGFVAKPNAGAPPITLHNVNALATLV